MTSAEFWKGKRVLVTGHTGFKGSWLCLWLTRLGAKVTGFSLEKYPNDILFRKYRLKINDIRGDIRDLEALKKAFDSDPEIVFHLAAQPIVRESYKDPLTTFHTNVLGTAHVMECLKNSNAKAAVIITSDKVYKNMEWTWGYRETDQLGGHDPYSASKACTELLVDSYGKLCSANVATARAGNVIGGGDFAADRIVPDSIAALKSNSAIKLRCPDAVRPWQHVLESVKGYLMLAEKLYSSEEFCGAWNFGPLHSSIVTVRELTEMMIDEWGSGTWENDGCDHPKETGFLNLDHNKARYYLGWTPKISLKKAIQMTIDWYRNEDNAYEICCQQIDDYER